MAQTEDKRGTAENKHIEYLEVLRVLSMLSVVFLHAAAGSLRGNYGSAVWHVSNVVTAVMSTSVPIFFMISGSVLMNSSNTLSLETTFKKRLPRSLVPFLVWSFVAVGYYAALSFVTSGNIDVVSAVKRIKNMVSQPTTIHLWFMYVLIPLYILSPLLKKLVDSLTNQLVIYMMALWLFFSSLLPTAAALAPARFRPLLTLNASYNLNFMSGYIGYFLAGYFLMRLEKRFSVKLLSGIIILDTVLISLGTWYKTAQLGEYSEVFKSYSKIFTLVLSVSIFLLMKELLRGRSLTGRLKGVIGTMSALSFGVYLLHNLLVDLISRLVKLWPAASLTVLFLSYAVVLVLTTLCIVVLASIKPICFAFTGLTFKNACEACNLQFFFRKIFKPAAPLNLNR